MLAKILVLILISINLYAGNALHSTYYVNSRSINLSSITSDTKNDFNIFTIEKSRFSKRVKTKDLIKLLETHGYKNYTSKSNYISFILKSPIDTSKIELSIKEYYQNQYEDIEITDIFVEPRAYIRVLPKSYVVNMRKRDFLSKSGTINIKTPQNKKIFFNYRVTATLPVYISRKKIKKDVKLSAINSSKKSIILDKFRAKPIQSIKINSLQSKHHIPKGRILTIRDVEALSVIKKNSFVNVSLHSDNMAITFSAKALQDGKVDDIIRVQKSDGKRFKVKVTGKNRAE
ncbi:MAG: flagellar basal body P-ring formation protein FlgA, partial [Sulfurimonas sp.]|nr:flagellar basal body P-ring formation protein FlgA [Sulfurimonas sp.]